MTRRAALVYALVSTYLVARLLLNRLLIGAWGVNVELVVEAILISLVQVGVLELCRLGVARPPRPGPRGGNDG